MKILGVSLGGFAVVASMPWWLSALFRVGGYALCIAALVVLYVAVHYLVEPYRPPWEASLFGARGAERIRRRRWLNPTRRES